MGNCAALGRPRVGSCNGFAALLAKLHDQYEVLRVVKMDGKILEFCKPVLVKDVLMGFSAGTGIGLSREAVERLPPDYELKLGKVYYVLPNCLSSVSSSSSSSSSSSINAAPVAVSPLAVRREEAGASVKRIKVVITKQQLQQLLTRQVSAEDIVLLELEKRRCRVSSPDHSPSNWKPQLECIPE